MSYIPQNVGWKCVFRFSSFSLRLCFGVVPTILYNALFPKNKWHLFILAIKFKVNHNASNLKLPKKLDHYLYVIFSCYSLILLYNLSLSVHYLTTWNAVVYRRRKHKLDVGSSYQKISTMVFRFHIGRCPCARAPLLWCACKIALQLKLGAPAEKRGRRPGQKRGRRACSSLHDTFVYRT